ncbi:ABC transporter ATP-binding protein/permease [Kitasatospora sp. NBC_01560]|uniref:ATP-binding cassette domain-containing protein n=1 Tax=Kitasatospora sp. NBC_01560 TaxID=2975965 RepID=UPI00386ED272
MRNPTSTRVLLATAGHVRGRLLAAAAVVLVSAGVSVATPGLLAAAVDALLHRSSDLSAAAALAVLLTLGALGEAVLAPLGTSAVARGTAWLRTATVRHLLGLGPAPGVAAGEAVTQLVQAAPQAAGLPSALVQVSASLAASGAAFVLLWLVDAASGLAMTIGMLLPVLLARRFVGDVTAAQGRYLAAQGRIAGRLITALAGARTIRASGTLRAETERVLTPLAEVSAAGHALWGLQRSTVWRLTLTAALTRTGVLAVAGLGVSSGRISPGELLAVVGYQQLAAGAVQQIDAFLALAQARAGAGRLAATLALPAPADGRGVLPPGPGALRLRAVTVRRAGTAVLDGADLDVAAGTSVALVGRTGAGKSVLAGLAGRLTDPDAGEVLIDGVAVHTVAREELSRAVVHAFERPVLIGATVHEAIAYGRPDVSRTDVVRAARAACADAFVRRLPAGYDTDLGAVALSGGERQRLGLARALARRGRVYVLDDATSGLDTVTEAEVSRAVTELLAGRTRLVVTHRAATAARCDQVAWVEAGRVRALAPHALLWQDPAYRAVFSAACPVPDATTAAPPPPPPPVPGPTTPGPTTPATHSADQEETCRTAV